MQIKMVIIVRADLNLTKGYVAKECGSAAIAAFDAVNSHPTYQNRFWKKVIRQWFWEGETKQVLKVTSEEQMEKIHN